MSNPSCLLRDPPGLGKTPTTLGALAWLKAAGEVNLSLIVVPKAVFGQWFSEKEKFMIDGSYTIEAASGNPAQRKKLYASILENHMHPLKHTDAIVMSYGILQLDFEMLKALPFDMVVFDEASALRNHDTKTYKAAHVLLNNPESPIFRRLAITATPINNNLLDIFNIGKLVAPERFQSRNLFIANHCNVREFKVHRPWGSFKVKKIEGYRNIAEFSKTIQSISIVRPMSVAGKDMPDLQIQDRWVSLTTAQEELYNDLAAGLLTISGENKHIDAMQQVLRLRQACADVKLVNPQAKSSSSKIEELESMLTGEYRNLPVVVFSQSLQFLQQCVYPMLKENDISFVSITGDENTTQIEEAKRKFNNDEATVMCITTAGEMGLNLQKAQHLICLDVLYNEARMRQLYGRIRRADSAYQTVFVTRLLVKDSIEENALKLLETRGALLDFMDSPSLYSSQTDYDTILKLINRKVRLLG